MDVQLCDELCQCREDLARLEKAAADGVERSDVQLESFVTTVREVATKAVDRINRLGPLVESHGRAASKLRFARGDFIMLAEAAESGITRSRGELESFVVAVRVLAEAGVDNIDRLGVVEMRAERERASEAIGSRDDDDEQESGRGLSR